MAHILYASSWLRRPVYLHRPWWLTGTLRTCFEFLHDHSYTTLHFNCEDKCGISLAPLQVWRERQDYKLTRIVVKYEKFGTGLFPLNWYTNQMSTLINTSHQLKFTLEDARSVSFVRIICSVTRFVRASVSILFPTPFFVAANTCWVTTGNFSGISR